MKRMKRALGLFVAGALLVSLLSACQSTPEYDPIQEVLGYSKDTVLATFDGEDITAQDYFYWLARYVDYIDESYKSMGQAGVNWDEEMGSGQTAREYLKTETLETVKVSWALEKLAAEADIALTDEDEETYQADREEAVAAIGGQAAYDRYLSSMCLTEEAMKEANQLNVLYTRMEQAFCREGGRFEGSREEIRAYLEEQGILSAKHILLLTKNPDTNEAYSEDVIAQQRAKAEELLAQLRASESPLTLFDELMQEHSEDTGLAANPDGYVFGPGQMMEAFEEGTRALDYGAISDIVETDFGYHIILRLDLTENAEAFQTYQSEWYGLQMDRLLQEKMDAIEVVTTEAFDNLDVQDFYEKLTAHREALDAQAQAEAGEANAAAEEQAGDEGADGANTQE